MKYRVNIDLANKTKSELSDCLDGKDSRVLNRVGAFSSLFLLDVSHYQTPVLVLKTEEPGSKQLLGFQHDQVESVCYDMIHHLMNDCIVMGAEPLAVQDLIVCGKMEGHIIKRIVTACATACLEQGCVLTGGETSEQPGILEEGKYILGSSIVGIVERNKIIDGSQIDIGDEVLALKSSGPHTNGYTLIRDLFSRDPELKQMQIQDRTFLDLVLEPHRCYYKSLKPLFKRESLVGLAHITGGGIQENLNRILPPHVDASIHLAHYKVDPVFRMIQEKGDVSDEDMLRTFNMGVGIALVCKQERVEEVVNMLEQQGEDVYPIGKIMAGNGNVRYTGRLHYERA